jgi:hypothetical protein
MGRRDWRIRPTEQSLEPPDDDDEDDAGASEPEYDENLTDRFEEEA